MRIKFIIPRNIRDGYVNKGMHDTLRHCLGGNGNFVVVDKNEDLVHMFGLWNNKYRRLANNLCKRGIPVVFTSIEGMAPLRNKRGDVTRNVFRRRVVREIVASCGGVQVCGNAEMNTLKAIVPGVAPDVIANPDFTQATDNDKMVALFAALYEKAQVVFDARLRESISKRVKEAIRSTDNTAGGPAASQLSEAHETMADICSRIVYLRHLSIKGTIPQGFLDETSDIMTKGNYDEAAMARLLKRVGMGRFAAYAMELLAQESSLTEGFMPVESRDGKTVERMRRMIIQ